MSEESVHPTTEVAGSEISAEKLDVDILEPKAEQENIIARESDNEKSVEEANDDEKESVGGTPSEAIQEKRENDLNGVDFLDDILKEADEKKEVRSEASAENKNDEEEDEGQNADNNDAGADTSSDEDDDSEAEELDGVEGQEQQEDEDEADTNEPIRSKNEIVDEEAPSLPENFKIDESEKIEEIGHIISSVEKSLIVKGVVSGEVKFLKEGSVLCLEDRTPVGYLFEIFGPIAHPLYRVKFNTEDDLERFKNLVNHKVFFVVPKSEFVLTETLKRLKGSDASNWNDEEIPEEEQEFSDDEKELEHKRGLNKRKRNKNQSEKNEDESEPKKLQSSDPSRYGYQSRSQREKQSREKSSQLRKYPIQPKSFQPPPTFMQPQPQPQSMSMHMPMSMPIPMPGLPSIPQFPMPLMPPMPPFGMSPQGNPVQWQQQMQQQMQQQYVQMQQMMMQQFYNNSSNNANGQRGTENQSNNENTS